LIRSVQQLFLQKIKTICFRTFVLFTDSL